MLRVERFLRKFIADRSGATAILAALIFTVLVGVVGLGVDYSRAFSAKTKLQAAADAAALSARAAAGLSAEEIRARALAAFEQNIGDHGDARVESFDATQSGDEVVVRVRASVTNTFSAIIGPERTAVDIVAASISATPDLEIALVLDNTGSMEPYMADLRQAATDLVDTLYARSASSNMKIAVVPYVGAVNIGNGPEQLSWMDRNGEAMWHAAGLETKGMGYQLGCVSPPGLPTDPGSGTHGSIWESLPMFAETIKNLFVPAAQAATAGDVPFPFGFAPPCTMLSPNHLNTFDLLAQIPNVEWKGCVEARAEPHDVTDTAPSTLDPDTLFVPWFWPDEADAGPMVAAIPGYVSANDYLPDRNDLRNAIAPVFNDPHPAWGWANTLKYNGTAAVFDEVAPDTTGPNKACPDALLPLTDNRAQVATKIADLTHWNGSGTNVAEGLAWGWRVLSPSAPFTEGAAYGQATKVIVLMTDGVNNIDPHPLAPVLSHYSAYGFLEQWGESRLTDKTYAGFKAHTDRRLAQACQNAKAEGISIYTVAFGITDPETLATLRSCATSPSYAYSAASGAQLVGAFQDVANRLSKLRLSR